MQERRHRRLVSRCKGYVQNLLVLLLLVVAVLTAVGVVVWLLDMHEQHSLEEILSVTANLL